MIVVPVIDLAAGLVAHGVRGERARYRPIDSSLCPGSADPLRVAACLTAHCATDWLYVADLDALQGGAVQLAVITALLDDDPARSLWLDAGLADDAAFSRLLAALGPRAARVTPVLASEAIDSRDAFARCRTRAPHALLSLDRRGPEQRLDPAALWDAPDLWPERVIVMTLERVGADAGPDLATVACVRDRAPPGTQIIGAGGIRDARDVAAAAACGATAWLVASALHDGRLVPFGDPVPNRAGARPHNRARPASHQEQA